MASPPPGSRLLITGVSGYIGFHILLDALRAGWAVRGTSRSQAKLDTIAAHPVVQATGPAASLLELVKVPGFDEEDELFAFYKLVLKGITHVIHTAAPLGLPGLDPDSQILRPGIAGVKGFIPAIEAADPPIRRLIVTSSFLANLATYPPDPNVRVTADTPAPLPTAEALAAPGKDILLAYRLAKQVILGMLEDFARRSRATDVVLIYPAYVHGGHEGATNLEEYDVSGMFLIRGLMTGIHATEGRVNGVIHITDNTAIHLAALDETKVPRTVGKPANLGAMIPVVYNDTWGIVERHFPGEIAAGIFSKGSQDTLVSGWDSSETEKQLGMKFRSYEEMVVDFARQYADLVRKSQD